MGYVRLMRSGGIHCCANASVFLPIVDAKLEFVTLCERDKLSTATIDAAQNLEFCISNLKRNYAEGTEYFKVKHSSAYNLQYPQHSFFMQFLFLSLSFSCWSMPSHRSSVAKKAAI